MKNNLIASYSRFLKGSGNKSEGTIEQYQNDLNIWANWMRDNYFSITKETIRKVELSHMHDFMFYLTEKGNCALTRRRKLSTLTNFFNYLKQLKLIKDNIMLDIESPKIEKKLPKHFDLNECKTLIECVPGRNKVRDTTIIKLFLSTGMRLSELVSLNVQDIQKNTLIINGKGNKERVIYLSAAIINQLEEYLKVRPKSKDDALFINENKTRLKKRGVQRVLKDAIDSAKLNESKEGYMLVHILRHSFATLNYQSANVDIRQLQKMLGHSDISTTQIYTQVADKQLSEAAENSPINNIL